MSQAAPGEIGWCVRGCTCVGVGVRLPTGVSTRACTRAAVWQDAARLRSVLWAFLPPPQAVLWGQHLRPDAAGQELPAGASGGSERGPAGPPREPGGCLRTPPSGGVAGSALA